MVLVELAHNFFKNFFQQTPWFVSPVLVPCRPCAEHGPPYEPVPKCKNYRSAGSYCSEEASKEPRHVLKFKKHDEASSIQLFYDLFFVANLTACTNNHDITDGSTLISYAGFFTLLWFTWFSSIIFDVRFAIDSWFTRLSKACSFGIMTAFAMTTIDYDPDDQVIFGHEVQTVSLILMTSRLFSVIQYGAIMISVYYRHRESVIKPFGLTMCTSLVAALAFWGLSRSEPSMQPYGYIGWYITSIVEAAVLLFISYKYEYLMKFDDTNIVERMGALTLIIMGEGIIGMTESVSLVLKTSAQISASTVGLLITVVLVVYVLWMLYFDHTDRLDHPSTRINKRKPWCQIWVFLHFPLHTAILLTLEGSARLMVWWNACEALLYLYNTFGVWTVQNGFQVGQQIQLQLDSMEKNYPFLTTNIENNIGFQSNFTTLKNIGTLNCSVTAETECEAWDIMYDMQDALASAICERLDIGDPSATEHSDEIYAAFELFQVWFITFFVAAGCVLILLALARYFGHQDMPFLESIEDVKLRASAGRRTAAWVAITMQCVIGIGLALVSLLALPKLSYAFYNFLTSAWIIPTVLLAFSLVIICDNLLYYWSPNILHLWSSDILHPPTSGSSAKEHCTSCGKSLKSSNEFAMESGNQLLKPSLSPNQRQFDRTSARTDYSNATEMPLLMPSLSSNKRDSDTISARTEYSRLPEDAEDGYGA